MRFKLPLLFAAFLLVPTAQTLAGQRPLNAHNYTIQVASFPKPAEARELVARLASLGERVTTSVTQLPDRSTWTRVLVGAFASIGEARRHAAHLLRRGVITEFFIRQAMDGQKDHPALRPSMPRVDQRAAEATLLPLAKPQSLSLTPSLDPRLLSRPDPVRLALLLIVGDGGRQRHPIQGGLWITGETAEGLARLRWIAGENAAGLFTVERDGRVKVDASLLAKAAGVYRVAPQEGPLAVVEFISSNEGLLLLIQLTQGGHRYRLHLARRAPTRGAAVEVTGGLNLDNNFDSRINPNRRLGKKTDNERPPDGFDSLIAINPVARWFNQQTNQLVPGAHILFHEMAEAHAKLELGLDYLGDSARPGAHDVALERERRLKIQRPLAGVVVTSGPNRVLRSEDEIREFFSQLSGHNR